MASQKLVGLQKAAIFFLSIDEDAMVEIFRHMEPYEVEQITNHMSRMEKVAAEDVRAVLDEFDRKAATPDIIPQANLKRVLSKALGEHQAAVKVLQELDPRTVLNLIGNEHPQIVAFIIAHLLPTVAVQVLAGVPEAERTDVLLRIIHLESSSAEVISDIEEVIKNKMASMRGLGGQKVGGIQVAIDLLNQMDHGSMNAVLATIAGEDPTLAEEIDKRLFSFEDLASIDDRSLQLLLRDVGREDLLPALKTASDKLKSRIFRNMSERTAQMLQEDLDALGPVRLRDVEKAQQTIVAIARKLEAEGKLTISGRGGTEETFV